LKHLLRCSLLAQQRGGGVWGGSAWRRVTRGKTESSEEGTTFKKILLPESHRQNLAVDCLIYDCFICDCLICARFGQALEVSVWRSVSLGKGWRARTTNRCRANTAHVRQSEPGSAPGFQVKVPETFGKVFPSRSAATGGGLGCVGVAKQSFLKMTFT